jgi:hypothetical protein
MTRSRPERFTAIMKAHVAALGDRDHRDVSAAELFPKIAEAVPGVTHEEIIAAFQHTRCRTPGTQNRPALARLRGRSPYLRFSDKTIF